MSDCRQLAEHYDAYALGALEGAERAEVEAHLARGCAECTQGVARSRWLVSQLAYLAADAEPPARLRERIAAAARPAGPVQIRPSYQLRSSRSSVLSWLAAAAMFLLAVFFGYRAYLRENRIADLQAKLEAEQAIREAFAERLQRNEVALAVLAAGDRREVALSAKDPGLATFRAYWNEKLGLVLTAHQAGAPQSGRTFQLWVVPKKGNPISAGVFSPDASGLVVYLTRPEATIANAAALAISDEPAGGSPQPTTTPIWVGAMK